jgi:hypothetical protein
MAPGELHETEADCLAGGAVPRGNKTAHLELLPIAAIGTAENVRNDLGDLEKLPAIAVGTEPLRLGPGR